MLTWLACRFAPRIVNLPDVPAPPLPEPATPDDLAARAAIAFAELEAVPFAARAVTHDPYRVLLAMGCRDRGTRAANQNAATAGRAPTYAAFGPWEPLEIPLPGGPTLTGSHSIGAPGAPLLIVVHGLFDSHVSFYVVEYAEVLRRWGFHVVALDLRDHGRMLGRGLPASLGLHEGKDLLAAARALSRTEGVSVGILGLSYGGQCAVRAAHEATLAGEANLLRGGVLALCAPLNVHEAVLALDDPARLPRPHGLVDRLILGGLLAEVRGQLHRRAGGRRLDKNSPFEDYLRTTVLPAYPGEPPLVGAFLGKARAAQPAVLTGLAVPAAIVHSVDDPFVPVLHARQAAEAAAGNPFVRVRELPAGGHCGAGPVDPDGCLRMLAAFFGRLRDG